MAWSGAGTPATPRKPAKPDSDRRAIGTSAVPAAAKAPPPGAASHGEELSGLKSELRANRVPPR
jgi:hypothetical protein